MDHDKGGELVEIAREEVSARLRGTERRERSSGWLDEERATFVTITQGGTLRGCIGSIEPSRSLEEDVRSNAWAAAVNDPRFPPLSSEDLDEVDFEVSVLTPMEPLEVESEEELLERIRPGIDGLYIRDGHRAATFLPQVWKSIEDPREFLEHLKAKARLPVDHWSSSMEVFTYQVDKYQE